MTELKKTYMSHIHVTNIFLHLWESKLDHSPASILTEIRGLQQQEKETFSAMCGNPTHDVGNKTDDGVQCCLLCHSKQNPILLSHC